MANCLLALCPDGRGRTLWFSSRTITTSEFQNKFYEAEGIPPSHQTLSVCGEVLDLNEVMQVKVGLRLVGGKGGFGSLLRGGNQGMKKVVTTNFDACRDLDGRRLRHTNNERKLRDWEEEKRREDQERKEEKEWMATKKEIEVNEKIQNHHQEKDIALDGIDHSLTTIREVVLNGKKEKKVEKKKDIGLDLGDYGFDFSDDEEDDDDEEMTKEEMKAEKAEKEEEEEDKKEEKEEKEEKKEEEEEKKEEKEEKKEEKEEKKEEKKEKEEEKKEEKEEDKKEEQKEGIDLSVYDTVEKLEALGGDALKEELRRLGRKCGGTVKERAQRLLSDPSDPPSKKRKRRSEKNTSNKRSNNGGESTLDNMKAPVIVS